MKITIESTSKIVQLNNVFARVWTGQTDSGIEVVCFVTRIAVSKLETRTKEFETELKEQKAPTEEIQAIPLRLII